MRMQARTAILAALLLGAPQIAGAQQPPLLPEPVVSALAAELSGETAKRNLEGVSRNHRTRGSHFAFLKQAFWNGAGRKQLTLKHGRLWSSYRPSELFRRQTNAYSLLRLSGALLGYLGYRMFGKPPPAKRS